MTTVEERFARVGEVELAYETFGDPGDPAVLMVMGLGAQMLFWPEELCELIAGRGYFVIRFDNRDVGRSTVLDQLPAPSLAQILAGGAEAPYLLQDMANDAVGLLDQLGIERAHVVGASLGGMIAQRIAIDHPEQVLTLASIMSTTGDRAVGLPTPEATVVLLRPPPTGRAAYIQAFLDARRVLGTKPIDERRSRRLAERTFDRGIHAAGGARQFAAIIASPDRSPELARIPVPTVVIHGDADPLIGISGGEATARAIPEAEMMVIEGMGHDLPERAWGPVAEALWANFERGEGR